MPYTTEENFLVEQTNKEINRHIRALTYDNNNLESNVDSLPYVQRILAAKYSDRIKASASDMLFGKMLDLDSGLFVRKEESSSFANRHYDETSCNARQYSQDRGREFSSRRFSTHDKQGIGSFRI